MQSLHSYLASKFYNYKAARNKVYKKKTKMVYTCQMYYNNLFFYLKLQEIWNVQMRLSAKMLLILPVVKLA